MDTVKVFMSGSSQAVRLPKKYRFEEKELAIKPFGEGVLLLPLHNPWAIMQEALLEFQPDFKLERSSQEQLPREDMF
ncbi:hypothetical protein A1D23_12435 [Chelonobacter oris]|uniref:antitoxin n=1 Tax=Chelonobacter oris TaxID=505317 RepID=UPI002448921D|nr:type II toxin-antitoxin system VapB family antitoxin [Chelonobacter oris]MDH3001326.1 hypothetical protein [Chelonobacter oris]